MADEEKKETTEVVEKDERELMMDHIVSRMEGTDDAEDEVGDDDEKVDEEVADDEDTEAPEEDTETEETEDVGDVEPEETEESITLDADGKEINVPLSKIIDVGKRTLQKEITADKRLSEATEILKSVKAAHGTPDDETDLEPGEEPGEQPSVGQTEYLDLAKSIQYGTEEEAAAAIAKLMQNGANQDDISRVVVDTVKHIEREKFVADIRSNIRKKPEEGGFSDLLAISPHMEYVIGEYTDPFLKDGEPNEWATYQKAGEKLRKAIFKDHDSKREFKDKAEKKRSVKNVKGASKRESKPPEKKPETNSEAIAAIAKARGQDVG